MKHNNQRYISKELTHFAGAFAKPDTEKQYKILLKILREGCLRHRFDVPDLESPARVEFNGSESFSDRKMITFDGVCFCDIPVADFPIHIGKYSPFGLSFLKSFLVRQGANPVFYIAKDSLLSLDDTASGFLFLNSPSLSRADVYDTLVRDHLVSHSELDFATGLELAQARLIDDYHKPLRDMKSLLLQKLIRVHFISFG